MRIGSIADALKTSKPKVIEAVPEQAQKESEEIVYKPLAEENARELLTSYAQHLQEKGRKALASYFVDPVFHWKEGDLEFVVGSKTLRTDLENNEMHLISFINAAGYNPSISYVINAEEISAYKLFTPKQQFDAIAQDYPILKEFEERFGLDFDA